MKRSKELNLLEPTTRDRWRGFYRLWRMAGGRTTARQTETGEYYPCLDAGACLRLVNWEWAIIAEKSDDSDGLLRQKDMPLSIRRRKLKIDKRRRQQKSDLEAKRKLLLLLHIFSKDE